MRITIHAGAKYTNKNIVSTSCKYDIAKQITYRVLKCNLQNKQYKQLYQQTMQSLAHIHNHIGFTHNCTCKLLHNLILTLCQHQTHDRCLISALHIRAQEHSYDIANA